MKRFALAAAVAAVAASLAFSALPAAADEDSNTPPNADDLTGMSTLGVDVSGVGTSASAVHAFLSQLSPETRHAVIGGCQTYLTAQEDAAPTVIPFCETAIHG
jgi:hypothetical protein